jgi:hypothetical protein
MTCQVDPDPTPASVANRPALSRLVYRVGTHARFKESMLRAIARHPELAGLTTRSDDDPTIALVDAWACVLHILTFYQERIASEGYLPTAVERRSILELARAIGYRLNPGVAAGTWCAFTIQKTPDGHDAIRLDRGTRVQSIPRQDELPQTFETVEAIEARIEWNAVRPILATPQLMGRRTRRLYLAGIVTNLRVGDLLLLVGRQRMQSPFSERWDVRTITSVIPVPGADHTIVTWREDLGHTDPSIDPAQQPTVHVFRQRASLFGHSAPDWRVLPEETRKQFDPARPDRPDWPDFENRTVADARIDLDRVYDDVLVGDWVLLDKPGYRELYRATEVFTDSRTDFTLTGKVTSIRLDSRNHLTWFPLRDSTVFTASRELPLALAPVSTPIFGDRIDTDVDLSNLEPGRTLLLRGVPIARLRVADRTRIIRRGASVESIDDPPLTMRLPNGSSVALTVGEVLEVLDAPLRVAGHLRWSVERAAGTIGTVDADEDDVTPEPYEPAPQGSFPPASPPGETVEVVTVLRIEPGPGASVIVLEGPLASAYHRDTVHVHANVAFATHGESRSVPLGSGDSAVAGQRFTLREKPLTYVPADTPSGAASTLEVRVNGIAWTETPTLYGQPPDARVFTTEISDEGSTTIVTGDGVHGSRLPTGSNNVEASFRVGIGLAGQVDRKQISLLMSRPLGLEGVINLLPASGAQDPESLDEARANAPLTVLTLDRIVSVRDFEDFARAFAGIGKAQATVLWNGERQLVHVTVGGADGSPIEPGEAILDTLLAAVDRARHPDQDVQIGSYIEQTFGATIRIGSAPGYRPADVRSAVYDTLLETFSFSRRSFAQSVTVSEILAEVHRVSGVTAAVLADLDGRDPVLNPRIPAARAHWDGESIVPAVLLRVDPAALVVEELAV